MGTYFYELLSFGAFYIKNVKNILSLHHFQMSDASSSRVYKGQCQSRLNGKLDG